MHIARCSKQLGSLLVPLNLKNKVLLDNYKLLPIIRPPPKKNWNSTGTMHYASNWIGRSIDR